MQNRGENAPVLTFLHPLRSMFASFTKHVCKPKHHHLKIVNTPFTKRKHGSYDTQTWLLRYANMAVTKHGIHYPYLFMRYCMKEADAFINRYSPSCKKWRRCRWVMPLSSLRVSKGVMEMTYLG